MSNTIVTLAHHLSAEDAERIGLPAEDLRPNTEIVVSEDAARGLISAGYAAVETEDAKAVARALRRHAPADHPVGVFKVPEQPQGVDDGKTAAERVEPASVDPGPQGTAAAAGSAPRRGGGKA